MIEIKDLYKAFGKQKVINGANLTIPDREVVTIMGKSGSGKSVLIKHIIGLLSPDSGSVLIDGVDITTLEVSDLDRIREKLGVLFQGGALFDSMTVDENVAFQLNEKTKLGKGEISDRVMQALEDVGLKDMGKKYPAELSGGMKKRAGLARALITEPAIVLFDEPTTGLDPIISRSIHRLISTTHEKYRYTAVIISHEVPGIFEISDKVAMLYNGIIEECGTPEEIMNSSNPVIQQFITGSLEGPIESLA
ncbi:MAG: ABC transporter ATP-binding protein [Thermodesulfovibrionales bacterium]